MVVVDEGLSLQVLRQPLGQLLLEELFQLVGVLVGDAVLLWKRERESRGKILAIKIYIFGTGTNETI